MAIILAAVAWLLTYLLHSTVLIGGAFALAGLGIVRSHAGRDTLWKVALIGGILTATAQTALRLQPAAGHVAIAARPESPFVDVAGVRDIAPAPAAPVAGSDAADAFAASIGDTPPVATADGPVRTTRPIFSGLHVSWPAMLLHFWWIGALGFGVRLLVMRRKLRRGLRSRRALDDGPLAMSLSELSAGAGIRPPRLSVSEKLCGPIAFGREICIPERVLSGLAPGEQRAVLAHELGHVVRRDPAWLMAAAIIESVLFFQPLNRLARRRLRAEAEYLCDDWAAERTGGVVLARCLAEVAGWVQGRAIPAAVAGMAGHCSQLVSRVERLLDGSSGTRPVRWIVRCAAGVLVMGLVAWSVPGVAAEDLGGSPDPAFADKGEAKMMALYAADYDDNGDETWGAVRDDGRLLILASGFSVRIAGQGRIGFQQWGRAIVVPEGYRMTIGGTAIDGDQSLCLQTRTVRLVEEGGSGSWELTPVRREGSAFAIAVRDDEHDREMRNIRDEVRNALRIAADVHDEVNATVDASIGGEADAAIDTLVQLWVRDPDAVRRAARRIARTYDRELRPQFESLGVEVGRELAPQLARLTDRVGRDLAPEFARLGAALGASILADLSSDGNPHTEDLRQKTKPKQH